jgi:NAD(P)-dependent dehydrogenase (short-subunit alcohol dehydrogenase family)
MSEREQRVAIITGGSQVIGAGLVAAYRRQGWAVVANARAIKPGGDRDVLTVEGDVCEPATTGRPAQWPSGLHPAPAARYFVTARHRRAVSKGQHRHQT